MAYEFKLPDLGEGLTEGEIARWLVAEGDEIAEDDPLVEVQTDKTTVEIPSPAAGKVARKVRLSDSFCDWLTIARIRPVLASIATKAP